MKGHSSDINCLLLIPNNRLVSGSNDWTLKVWDLGDFICLNTLNAHTHGVNSLELLPKSDGSVPFIASGSSDWSIKIWKEE